MHELPIDTQVALDNKFWFYSLHKTLGITVFAVAIIRVLWAIVQPHPKSLNAERKLESLAAQTVHWVLYASIILMPLTGWLHHSATQGFAPIWWPLFQDLPGVPKNEELATVLGATHFMVGVTLVVSLFLHIGGALKHAVIDRDSTLARMIPGMAPEIPQTPEPKGSNHLPVFLATVPFVVVGVLAISMFSAKPVQQTATISTDTAQVNDHGWIVDHEKSTLGIQIVQAGAPVAGSFGNWKADINFDPENLDASKIAVEVEIASLTLGGVTSQATSADFLNAAAHPTAIYRAEEVASVGEDTFEARGQLTLAGVTKPLPLPFTLRIQDDRAFVTIDTTLQRIDFGVGAKGFPDGSTVALDVKILVELEANRAN